MTTHRARAWADSAGLSLNYALDLARLAHLAAPIVRLDLDADTARYLELSRVARHGRLMTWLHRSLRGLLSDFDINGYLGTYPMHVLSTAQWKALLGEHLRPGHLLDVGAGRGDVTGALGALFEKVTVTETSRGMARRLRKHGYEVIEGDLTEQPPTRKYQAVSLLNVLDRCQKPLSLLGAARSALESDGLLIIALVLPYQPFFYQSGQASAPAERLPITSREFEEAAAEFVSLALLALGLEVLALSRAPYLSGGDASLALYELDDLLVVCRAVGEPPPILGRAPACL